MDEPTIEHNLGPVDAIPLGRAREYVVAGQRVAVFRLSDGRLFASEAYCPHAGAPLVGGWVRDASVTCPYHGWQFALDTGLAILGGCSLLTYTVRVDDEQTLHLSLTPPRPEAPSDAS